MATFIYHPKQGGKVVQESEVAELLEKGWATTPTDFLTVDEANQKIEAGFFNLYHEVDDYQVTQPGSIARTNDDFAPTSFGGVQPVNKRGKRK